MKKLLIIALAGLALTGCSGRYVGPALVGGAVGYALGSNNHPHVVVQQGPTVVRDQVVIMSDQCNQFPYAQERMACERGARQRFYEEQRKRETEAYRQGYGR